MTLPSSPRCVADFVISPADVPQTELGSFDGENHFFALGCPCSGRNFVVRSIFARHFYLEHAVAYGPIALRCVACARERICFAPSEHGFDAELDFSRPPDKYREELESFGCPRCHAEAFEVIARFEYPVSERPRQSTESLGPADEDLFTYFMLIGTCHSCKSPTVIADVQCA
jgi:hypothetical protein